MNKIVSLSLLFAGIYLDMHGMQMVTLNTGKQVQEDHLLKIVPVLERLVEQVQAEQDSPRYHNWVVLIYLCTKCHKPPSKFDYPDYLNVNAEFKSKELFNDEGHPFDYVCDIVQASIKSDSDLNFTFIDPRK